MRTRAECPHCHPENFQLKEDSQVAEYAFDMPNPDTMSLDECADWMARVTYMFGPKDPRGEFAREIARRIRQFVPTNLLEHLAEEIKAEACRRDIGGWDQNWISGMEHAAQMVRDYHLPPNEHKTVTVKGQP